jgi:hypothetical protein
MVNIHGGNFFFILLFKDRIRNQFFSKEFWKIKQKSKYGTIEIEVLRYMNMILLCPLCSKTNVQKFTDAISIYSSLSYVLYPSSVK